MAQKRKTKKRNPLQTAILAALALVIVAVLAISLGKGGRKSEEAAIENGLNYLSQQEQKKPEAVRQARQELHKRRLEAQKDELFAKLESGEIDPFTVLQDYVVMGDSRTAGFSFWGFLPEERAMAGNGYKIFHIPEWHDKLKQMQPQYVFLCYGINDCACQYWSSGEEHSADYIEYIRELQELLPNTTFVVSSILPVLDFAIEDYPDWKYLPDWNAALKKACKEADILFADCDYIFEEYSHLWYDDGFHFDEGVYPYWTSTMVITALYGDLIEEV